MGSGDRSADSRQTSRKIARPSSGGGRDEHLSRPWDSDDPRPSLEWSPDFWAPAARGALLCSEEPALIQLDKDACGLPSNRFPLAATSLDVQCPPGTFLSVSPQDQEWGLGVRL